MVQGRLWLGCGTFAASVLLLSAGAQAHIDHPAVTPAAVSQTQLLATAPARVADAAIAPPAPSVETPLHRLFCVEYARARSGLKVFGDAKTWWQHARKLYARLSTPVKDAVMVFSGSKRIRHGHVAVVAAIVGPREIRVDQANWQNHGEIDLAIPVRDVSAANDWSKVRVWDIASHSFGIHVYAIEGFVAKELARQAAN